MMRTRVMEGMGLATSAKTAVVDNASNSANDLSTGYTGQATDSVQSIDLTAEGIITITFTGQAGGGTIIMSPSDNNGALVPGTPPTGSVSWDCTGGTQVSQYRPIDCR